MTRTAKQTKASRKKRPWTPLVLIGLCVLLLVILILSPAFREVFDLYKRERQLTFFAGDVRTTGQYWPLHWMIWITGVAFVFTTEVQFYWMFTRSALPTRSGKKGDFRVRDALVAQVLLPALLFVSSSMVIAVIATRKVVFLLPLLGGKIVGHLIYQLVLHPSVLKVWSALSGLVATVGGIVAFQVLLSALILRHKYKLRSESAEAFLYSRDPTDHRFAYWSNTAQAIQPMDHMERLLDPNFPEDVVDGPHLAMRGTPLPGTTAEDIPGV